MSVVDLIDDRYEQLEVIASGGMATVWKARDTRLDRLVALKRPHPAPPGEDTSGRMEREARAAASLSHPHLITVYDYGSDEAGPYLVMELVEGPTLDELSGEIDTGEAIDIGTQLAEALAVIHASGIVHRDVKPANVIMSERGPLLTDFGIAFDPGATSKITAPGEIVATPAYAAPEVLAGAEPTTASDIYSLAVMVDDLIEKSGSEASADIPAVLGSALSLSPEDRPDAPAFAAGLRRGAPTVTGVSPGKSTLVMKATPPLVPEDEVSPRRSVPAWMWVAGLLVLLAIGLAASGLFFSDRETPADAALTPLVSTTLAAGTTTSTVTTISTTTISTTTTVSFQTSVAEARSELEAVLLQPPRSDVKQREARDLLKKVDEAIEAANEDDLDKAEEKLSEAAKDFEDKLEGDRASQALLVLDQLAALLGVELDRDDDDDDD
jgi:eukaryotic-like serine/threonine-protein kinase